MLHPDRELLQELSDELASLCRDMLQAEASLEDRHLTLHEAHRESARNLSHYLALRNHDVRKLQTQLARLGLSSLGRTESHVLDAVHTVHRVLNVLLGSGASLPHPAKPCVAIGEGAELLNKNTDALLGPRPTGRKVRIMVTMGTEAGSDYEHVRDLVQGGMDCMRINCAHDNPEVWLGMIDNLKRARQETGRGCSILMDVPGPKLRTGLMEPGPAVVKCRPKRDVYGRVVAPARIWLTPGEVPESTPPTSATRIPLPTEFLRKLHVGDKLRFRDARKAHRSLHVVQVEETGCWAEARQTIYFLSGLKVGAFRPAGPGKATSQELDQARIGKLPQIPQTLLLKEGETLLLTRAKTAGKNAVYGKSGALPFAGANFRFSSANPRSCQAG